MTSSTSSCSSIRRAIVYAPETSTDLRQFIQTVADHFTEQGTVIYNERNQIRVLDVNGQAVNVKKFCVPPTGNRLLYSLGIRTPKAKAAYCKALTIRQRGFPSPQPYGYILERKRGLLTHAYLITEHLTDYQALAYKGTPKSLIRQVARFMAQLHEKGLLHRDLTPNNVLFKKEGDKYQFSLVDVNQFIIQKKPIPASKAMPYLIQLFLGRKDLRHFITAYSYCRHLNPKYLYLTAVRLRRGRTFYSRLKKLLKKLPGARLVQTNRLGKKQK